MTTKHGRLYINFYLVSDPNELTHRSLITYSVAVATLVTSLHIIMGGFIPLFVRCYCPLFILGLEAGLWLQLLIVLGLATPYLIATDKKRGVQFACWTAIL
jgi:hypothetical protein